MEIVDENLVESCYLIVNKSGIVKMRKTKPALTEKEIAIMVKIKVPLELFEKPMYEASIEIQDDIPSSNENIRELEIELQRIKNEE